MAEQGSWLLGLVIVALVLGDKVLEQTHIVASLVGRALGGVGYFSVQTHYSVQDILALIIAIRNISSEFSMRLVVVVSFIGLLPSLINNRSPVQLDSIK